MGWYWKEGLLGFLMAPLEQDDLSYKGVDNQAVAGRRLESAQYSTSNP